ncbi:MAG: hypothetical protein NWE95_01905 [Candidatus Bathyarchaeota archaeon]|nr:hypothetical protein [Candidatus Bathyarchaeota archaeon]
MKSSENPKSIVKDVVSKYFAEKPRKISLKLYWTEGRSEIIIAGKSVQTVEYPQTIDFTSFANGVLEAYRDVYGELKVVPISFREEIYRNDKVSLDLYPSGSAGAFDIFVEYAEGK